MWIRRRYDDPTCIQYFFYFTDELEKLVEDYNALMSALSRPSLNKDHRSIKMNSKNTLRRSERVSSNHTPFSIAVRLSYACFTMSRIP
jgi:hypothetical protein